MDKLQLARLDGRTALVTAATGGIGRETAQGLLELGARVVLVGRDPERGERALRELRRAVPGADVELVLADLALLGGVQRVADRIQAHQRRLDLLVNNVGGVVAARRETAEGLEATLAVNVLGPFLLTQQLLPLLRASEPARVVNLTSSAHRAARLRLDDLQSVRSYRSLGAYARAKLAVVLLTYELARRLEGSGVTAFAADPGGADTPLTRSMYAETAPLLRPLAAVNRRLLQRSAAEGAQSSLYAAAAPELDGRSGLYVTPKSRPGRSARRSYDAELAGQLWERCEVLVARRAHGLAGAPS